MRSCSNDTCEGCEHWNDLDGKRGRPKHVGECRVHAPTVVPTGEGDTTESWPCTWKSDWCGDFLGRSIKP